MSGAARNFLNLRKMSGVMHNAYKLFVGNLPWTVSSRELELYFSKYGHVASATVIFDQDGHSKQYGFVVFSKADAFNSARNQNRHFLEGRVLSVEVASK